ncbi:type III secretion system protein SctP [Burkholderia singularis]|uniref:type III secretion system protein SctP n=1 Tax=Burkholderia singularis TaxID=1503053 RepID=UPI0009EAF9C1|nr:type III secretion system protein SctP [Burkholderia singularis]
MANHIAERIGAPHARRKSDAAQEPGSLLAGSGPRKPASAENRLTLVAWERSRRRCTSNAGQASGPIQSRPQQAAAHDGTLAADSLPPADGNDDTDDYRADTDSGPDACASAGSSDRRAKKTDIAQRRIIPAAAVAKLGQHIASLYNGLATLDFGEWQIHFPLDEDYFGPTRLTLSFSPILVQLRFDTSVSQIKQLLLDHSGALQRELDQTLRACGETRQIEIFVW